jgi:hypothetical protein
LRRVGIAPLDDPVEEAVKVDQPVLHADPVQRLVGIASRLGSQPSLVRLDVMTLEVVAAGDLGVSLGQPGTELAQVMLDMANGVGPQTELDLSNVAASRLGEPRRDRAPAGL